MNPHLLVGCPVLRREWILPAWFSYTEATCGVYGVEPEYIFVCDRRDPSREIIDSNAAVLGRRVHYVDVVDHIDHPHEHAWANKENLFKMVELRNYLLEKVREIQPHLFFSLDSDILCHPQQLSNLVETLTRPEEKYHAVGGKVFLGPGKNIPSWCYFSRVSGMKRYDVDHVMDVDVIMAVKLMSPLAYNVDYVFNDHGEDIGWSLECNNQGLRLGFDGRVTSKHVMSKTDPNGVSSIEKVDPRVGF